MPIMRNIKGKTLKEIFPEALGIMPAVRMTDFPVLEKSSKYAAYYKKHKEG